MDTMMKKLSDSELKDIAGGRVSEERALAKALGHAGLRDDQVKMEKLDLGNVQGREAYEIKFSFNHVNYTCLVSAESGNIIKFEKGFI